MAIFGNAWGSANVLWRHSTPNSEAVYPGGLEASGDILGGHLLQESLSDHIVKFSLFSLRAVLTNYLTVHCIIYHHSALHQSFYFILLSTSYNKSALSAFQDLCLESWVSILKCPARAWTNFLEEPTARSTPAYLISSITLSIQHIFIFNESGQTFSHYWLHADDATVCASYKCVKEFIKII